MCNETQTLWIMWIASWLMGFDYLFNERLRRLISIKVRKFVWRTEKEIDRDIQFRVNFIKERAPFIIAAFIFIIVCLFLYGVILLLQEWLNVWILILIFLAAMVLMSGAVVELAFLVLGNMLPVITYVIPSIVFKLVRKCPKGIIFGIGFVMLQTSFVCRFYGAP